MTQGWLWETTTHPCGCELTAIFSAGAFLSCEVVNTLATPSLREVKKDYDDTVIMYLCSKSVKHSYNEDQGASEQMFMRVPMMLQCT